MQSGLLLWLGLQIGDPYLRQAGLHGRGRRVLSVREKPHLGFFPKPGEPGLLKIKPPPIECLRPQTFIFSTQLPR